MRPLGLAVFLPFVLGVVFSALPVRGETCSARINAAAGDDLTTLRDKTIAAFRKECRPKKDQLDESKSCEFSTVATDPFMLILRPVSMPFRLEFAVKSDEAVRLALAENTTPEAVFADMAIGAVGNSRALMRPCDITECPVSVARHDEADLVDANEYRPFWVDYKGGVVKVGKGGQEEAFLEWDAGAYHGRVPTQVRIGIASRGIPNADWVFYTFCE